MISRAAAPSSSSLSQLSTRSLRAHGVAARSFATVQEAPPVKHHGGLQDQDRIFTNLYGHHGADLKSAMKYGDWHRTKDIVLKGHDWVSVVMFPVLLRVVDREDSMTLDFEFVLLMQFYSSFLKSRPLACVAVVVPVSPLV